MKAIIALMFAVVIIPSAMAIGMIIPDTAFSTMRMGSNKFVNITVTSSNETADVTVFATSSNAALYIEGSTQFTQVVHLLPGKSATVEIELQGKSPKTGVEVTYGFYKGGSGSGVNILQKTQKKFTLDVLCPVGGCQSTNTNTNTNTNTQSNSGGGGGGGGGGANSGYYPGSSYLPQGPNTTINKTNETNNSAIAIVPTGQVIKDAVPSEETAAEQQTLPQTVAAIAGNIVTTKGGKEVLIGVMALILLTLVTGVFAIGALKGADI